MLVGTVSATEATRTISNNQERLRISSSKISCKYMGQTFQSFVRCVDNITPIQWS